ncbi:non-homologous end-joining DNA ligase [Thalassospira sp.]|uniref:non-homologous end-joining DNA ligase n=1 Tax=Thalassospira sp. TaxID=1912094 RepID=UPI0025EC9EFF|nr:non-homologous end-joining DNA ligase [Thalassospira sp.]
MPERDDKTLEISGINITHPDQTMFPDAGLRKGDLARHYHRIGDRMRDIIAHRPLSLVRCPDGLKGDCFYQRHVNRGFPDQLREIDIAEKSGGTGKYLYLTSVAGLIGAVQMGTVEFHPWGARTDDIEKPDRVIFDLDPDKELDFAKTKKAAFEMRDRLSDLGLSSTAMVTGGKGIHVIVHLRRTVSWDDVKGFAKTLATTMADDSPDRFTATMSKEKRSGKIFIDWLRNERSATSIAPYAVRSRAGAPVALPVRWAELDDIDAANVFHVGDMENRLKRACPYLGGQADLQTLSKSILEEMQKQKPADN